MKRPWIGSVDSSIKLSDKGTLSEGSAKVDDQTIKTFLDFIPTTVEAAAKAAPAFAPMAEARGLTHQEAVKAKVVVTATLEPQ